VVGSGVPSGEARGGRATPAPRRLQPRARLGERLDQDQASESMGARRVDLSAGARHALSHLFGDEVRADAIGEFL
jgi:hypothetical protein